MAARIGDPTAHGGVIVLGCFTVIIGEVGMGTPGGPEIAPGAPGAPKPTKHTPPPAPVTIMSRSQAKRGRAKFETLSQVEKKHFLGILREAHSNTERLYIWKAFAACHTVAECEEFAKKVHGKKKDWLTTNLKLTGSPKGRGVQQQWSHSCNATTVQAIHGEMDPIYSLKVHEENPHFGKVDDSDANKQNPNLAAEQKAILESQYAGTAAGAHSGVAASRDNIAMGSGRWASDKFNDMSALTGVKYTTEKDPNISDAMKSIDAAAKQDVPVPIVIGNGAGQYTHYVLITHMNPGPPKTYTIHDPWSGKTVKRSADKVKNGKMDIAGSNQITAVENPKLEATKPSTKPTC